MPNLSTPESAPAKTVTAISIFVVCCLLSSARLVVDATTSRHTPDGVAKLSDQRFPALKAALPQRGVVGYIGESGNSGTADYYLTQYALAPLLIENSTNHDFVIGNFPASPPARFPQNLQLVKDFGNGVLLFRNLSFNKDAQ
jgi:hypothetical protein